MLEVLIFFFGLVVGFVSGMLGIGGGIIMAPLLLYVPPLLGVGQLDMKDVAGLTMVQGLVATLSGVLVHRRFRFVSKELVIWMGSSIAVASLTGASLSKWAPEAALRGIFAIIALVAATMMFLPKREAREDFTAEQVSFSKPLAVTAAAFVGFFTGMVGQGGAFLLIPTMLYVLRLPIRVVIGSSLGIVFFSALAGFIGKLGTGQIPFLPALALVASVVPSAQLGGYVSRRTPTKVLRTMLAAFIALTAIKMGTELVWGQGTFQTARSSLSKVQPHEAPLRQSSKEDDNR